MSCQYDWVETHINLQGGELAFTPRLGFLAIRLTGEI